MNINNNIICEILRNLKKKIEADISAILDVVKKNKEHNKDFEERVSVFYTCHLICRSEQNKKTENLTKKIEEQNKKIEEQNKKIEDLTKKIDDLTKKILKNNLYYKLPSK